MAGSTYLGIPRKEIPWYPSINQDVCTNCGVCRDFCNHDVFAHGKIVTIVINPYNCVVGCLSCLNECTSDALSFPDLNMMTQMLSDLREKHKKPRLN